MIEMLDALSRLLDHLTQFVLGLGLIDRPSR
ncbi:hypothetical protein GGP66_003277 [Salinibacter ruber]|uniref:Uncharacterized protein n=1 Tax=Salinibacter ruber TaxID=146919 RepID=A0A9X2UN06_9BACT|nr:hypothetical protein [Salinibacter ruber]MCS3616585.1 hypothetical protein [Salinibacter ruber]MCS3675827.1 hypothetical protein [Salinibacter ruber]MCS4037881.1 hypothetical protein [Salinibacter ruber]